MKISRIGSEKSPARRVPIASVQIDSCLSCPARDEGVFCRLDQETLTALDAIRQTTVYPKGAILFVSGQTPRGIFILCEGRAKLTLTSPRSGQSFIVGIVGRGNVLGLDAVVLGTPHQVSAETLGPTHVNFVGAAELSRLFEAHAGIRARVTQSVASELRHARTQAARIALARTVEGRLAGLLLELAVTARRDDRGVHMQLGLTHEEIAALIGTSRETVTRLLNGLRRRGLLRIKGGLITISDPARLAAIEQTIPD